MMAWLPIFFMYFNEGLELKEVLLLEAIYYFGVFILEVPSGYFSDVIGRRKTLIISAVSFAASYLLFTLAHPQFGMFAIAQVLLAFGFSFMSGTNTAFYYESLQEQGLEAEFAHREGKVQSYLRYAGGVAALIGGLVGSFQLKYGFAVSFLFVIPALLITLRFKEPRSSNKKIALPIEQLKSIIGYLKVNELRWLFVYYILVYVLAHIPYEFYQPYLLVLEKNDFSLPLNAALYSGILFAGTRFFGAFTAAKSISLAEKYGLKKLCYTSIFIQLALIGILGFILHPAIILLILLRSVSMSLTAAPVNSEITPRLKKEHRATYLSIQSLLSRFSFSMTLLLLAIPINSQIVNDWETVSMIFRYSLYAGIVITIPLFLMNSSGLFEK